MKKNLGMPSPENLGPVTIYERYWELKGLSEESPARDHVRQKIKRALRRNHNSRLDKGN